jgi:hypothetical protein
MPACPRWCPGALMLGEEAVQLRAGRTAAFRWVEGRNSGCSAGSRWPASTSRLPRRHVQAEYRRILRFDAADGPLSLRPRVLPERQHPPGRARERHRPTTDTGHRPCAFIAAAPVLGTDRRHPAPTQPGPDRAVPIAERWAGRPSASARMRGRPPTRGAPACHCGPREAAPRGPTSRAPVPSEQCRTAGASQHERPLRRPRPGHRPMYALGARSRASMATSRSPGA